MDILLVVTASLFIIRRQKLEWALVIIMALGTNLFQASKVFKDFLYIPNIQDGALILILLMFILYNKKSPCAGNANLKPIHNITYIFFAYFAFTIFIDLVINGTSIVSVLKTSRHWLCLLAVLVIPKLPYNVLYKAIRIIFYITIVISAINVIEFITGTEYFTNTLMEDGVRRGALPSYYALFYLFAVFTDYLKFSKVKKYIYLAILAASLLVSSTRSIALGIVVGVAVCIYFLSANKFTSFLKLGFLCIFIYIASFAMPTLHKRFNEAFDEFTSMESSSKNLDVEGNMTFRLYMLAERYQYLKTSPQYHLFGIGNVIEQDFPTTFYIGGFNKEMQRPTQLDTGDIAWPSVILRLGMIGLVLFLIMVFKFIFFTNKIPKDRMCITLKAFLISNLFVTSFAESRFSRGEFWIMPIICIAMINYLYLYSKQKQITENTNN